MFLKLLQDYKGQKAGAIIDVASDDAAGALIDAKVAEKSANDPTQDLLNRALAGMTDKISSGLNATFEKALLEFQKSASLSWKNGKEKIFGAGNSGDPNKTFGKFLHCVRERDIKTLEAMGSQWVDWESAETKAQLNTVTGAQGGFTVPEEHYLSLIQIVAENSIVRPRAMIIPMKAKKTRMPYIDIVTTGTAGESNMFGGFVMRWSEEAGTPNQSEPAFKETELENYELSGLALATNTYLQDSAIGTEPLLMQIFAKCTAWTEDYAFLRGNGTGKPEGVLTWAGLISITRSAASAFALADYANIMARWLPNFDTRHACWTMHPTVLPKFLQMADAAGNLITVSKIGERVVRVIDGLPIEITEKAPALNTAGDVTLHDFSKYVIGDRQQYEVAFSEHAYFTTNRSAWRVINRVGGKVWLRDKITLADQSNTLSPFVTAAAG